MKKIQRKRRVQPPAQRKPVLQPVSHGSTSVVGGTVEVLTALSLLADPIPISLVFVRT